MIAAKKSANLKPGEGDYTFYQGKIASARYYANNILPNVSMLASLIKSEEDSVLTCPEEALVVEHRKMTVGCCALGLRRCGCTP